MSYYKEPNSFRRIYMLFRNYETHKMYAEHYGWFVVLKTVIFGGMLPPPLKHWAVAKGWPRKNKAEAVAILS